MSPYYEDDLVTLHHGDCLAVLTADTLGYDYRLGYALPAIPDASVDAVVTDPPYGLGFMGKEWDALPPGEEWARECRRVLKPGGHLLAFGGSRTWHRLAVAIEDGGFEIRDSIAWLYGSGFPKSMDVSKAIDKSNGENRARQLEFTAWMRSTGITAAQINVATDSFMGSHYLTDRKQAAIATADMFDRIRPLLPEVPERIERLIAERTGIEWTEYVNRPVLRQVKRTGKDSGTYGAFAGDNFESAAATDTSATWEGWGTALKPAFEPIVVGRKPLAGTVAANVLTHGTGALNIDGCRVPMSDADADAINAKHAGMDTATYERKPGDSLNLSTNPIPLKAASAHDAGRWPANVVLDESQAALLDEQSGESQSRVGKPRGAESGDGWGMTATGAECDDLGGASRFFYVAKADSSERVRVDGIAHPTVKPLDLMRWLVRLVTPPGGTVLEPFAGSGTTVEACLLEGFKVIAIEREADYLPLIEARIARRRDPVRAVKLTGADAGLFDLLDGDAS